MIKHLEENDISYFSHFKRAMSIGIPMVMSGLCCIVHAFFPFIFTHTASKTIKGIYDQLWK